MARAHLIAVLAVLSSANAAIAESYCESAAANPNYCRDGKPRNTCTERGVVVWEDTRQPVNRLQLADMAVMVTRGVVPSGPCAPKAPNFTR